MIPLVILLTFVVILVTSYAVFPSFVRLSGQIVGGRLVSNCQQRRELILNRVNAEKKKHEDISKLDDDWEKVSSSGKARSVAEKSSAPRDRDWAGIIGFFHPFCNAGGGGERVLWAAVHATQQRWPNAVCAIYTGDHDVSKDQMLKRVEVGAFFVFASQTMLITVQERFAIHLHAPTVVLLYLSTRHFVLASTWPRFTLLGQSLGSLILAWDAFTLMVPDIYIDTAGYAFTVAMSKFLFPRVPTGAYVHYPTISTDMLSSLDAAPSEGRGLNAGSGKGTVGKFKRRYWQLFARLYSWVGGSVDVVMCNGTWTAGHIRQLWSPSRAKRNSRYPIEVVFPPCAVEDMESKITVDAATEKNRKPTLIYIAQFRPEKNHQMILRAFSRVVEDQKYASLRAKRAPHLLLMGSVRDSADETFIYSLRLLVNELRIKDSVTFVLNASWSKLLGELQTCSIGVNGMWNEHFGMGVVEYQAAGLISVVNDSGGPKWDIVTDQGNGPTGYHASTEAEFADGFARALSLDEQEALQMRLRARHSSKRFSEEAFEGRWLKQIERLIAAVA